MYLLPFLTVLIPTIPPAPEETSDKKSIIKLLKLTPKLPKDAEMLSFSDMPKFVKAGYDSTIKEIPKLLWF